MRNDNPSGKKMFFSIRRKHGEPEKTALLATAAKKFELFSATARNKLDDHVSALLKNNFFKQNILNPHILKMFNKVAVAAVAAIAAYFFLDSVFVSPSRKAASLISGIAAERKISPITEKAVSLDARGYEYYLNKVSGKNVFSAGAYDTTDAPEAPEAPDDLSNGNIGLVGVIPGDEPQAIIENKKSQKTYYLIKGESVDGITAEEIDESRVVLEYNGKRKTLIL